MVAERGCSLAMAGTIARAGTTKVPPPFNEETMEYEQWKKDISLWTVLTDLDKKKHAIAIHLSLQGRARKASSEISVDDMKSDNGLTILLEKLDRVYLQDANWKCFNTYLSFESYRRPEKCSIDEYLSEFDLRHYKLKECGVTLPDAVIACRLLKSCGLSDMHFQLALSTTAKMTFENMRATLKKLFAESGHLLTSSEGTFDVCSSATVKVEAPSADHDVLYGTSNRRRFGQRRGYRANFRHDISRPDVGQDKRNNPLKSDGTVSVCAVCGSKMHWARQCPHSYEKNTSSVLYSDDFCEEEVEEVQVTLLAQDDNMGEKMNSLLGQTIGAVLLDSGCTKTVCGELWLNLFLETLTPSERNCIQSETSSAVYRFGDGKRMTAERCVTIPCILAGKKICIKTDVVQSNIPLLLSRSSMKRAGMVIDLSSDTAVVFGKKVNLGSTTMGHYTLPIFYPPTTTRMECILLNSACDMTPQQVALKLHRQFAHPTTEKLKKFIKDAGKDDAELLKAVDIVACACPYPAVW